MSACAAEEVAAAGTLDQLRDPVARRHQRIEPLQARDRRPMNAARTPDRDALDTFLQLTDNLPAFLRRLQRVRHLLDALPYLCEIIRRQRDDPGLFCEPGAEGQLNVLFADSTDLALCLRDDDVGLQLLQEVRIDAVDRGGLLQKRL